MNKKELIVSIKKFIQFDETDDAFQDLNKLIQQTNRKTWHNTTSMLQSRWQSTKRNQRNDLLPSSEINIEKNRIHQSILGLVDEIAQQEGLDVTHLDGTSILQEDSGSNNNDVPTPTVISDNDLWFTKTKGWQWLLAAAVIISITSGIFQCSGCNIKDDLIGKPIDNTTANVTIKVRPKGDYELPKKGTVNLSFGGESIPRIIDSRGIASFPEVPNRYFTEDSKVKITFNDPDKEPFNAVFEDSLYQLEPNSIIELLVELKGLDKLYGVVKDFKSGNLIEGVRVSILDQEVFTDKNGWFNLSIPPGKQKKFHNIRASKDGYIMYEQDNIPAQTDKEMKILLKKQ